jgi:hypothetical protein
MLTTRRDPLARLLALAFVGVTVALVGVIFIVPVYSVGEDVTAPDGSTTTITRYETVLAANRGAWLLLVGLIVAGIVISCLAVLAAWRGSSVARFSLAAVIALLSVLTVAGMASFGMYSLPAMIAGAVVVARSRPVHRVARPKRG